MKKNIFGLSLCAIAISGLMLVSCETETVYKLGDVPGLTVSSAVAVGFEGGQYTCTYSLVDAGEEGYVECLSDKSWISDVADSSGVVSFTVGTNTDGEIRSGFITVAFHYATGYVSKTVGVIQDAYEAPVLTVQPAAVMPSYNGGSYSFTYRISNPADDGDLTCSSDSSWVHDFDYSSYGTIGLTIDSNPGTDLRDCEIEVTYSYTFEGEPASVTTAVAVVQDHRSSFGVDVESLLGTYTAEGYAYSSGSPAFQTWTLRIYASENSKYDVFIDGLTPQLEDYYTEYDAEYYIAQAKLNAGGQLVIPTQLTGYQNNDGYLIGWTPCVEYDSTYGWLYSMDWPSCTFSYDGDAEIWTSDYGEWCALFSYDADYDISDLDNFLTGMMGYFDVTSPGVVLTKTSSSTSSLTTTNAITHNIDENLVLYKDYMFAK